MNNSNSSTTASTSSTSPLWKGLPANPRNIQLDKLAKLKRSILDNPEMLQLRGIRSPRGCAKFSTWRRNKTSEESNETSEEMIRLHVENKK